MICINATTLLANKADSFHPNTKIPSLLRAKATSGQQSFAQGKAVLGAKHEPRNLGPRSSLAIPIEQGARVRSVSTLGENPPVVGTKRYVGASRINPAIGAKREPEAPLPVQKPAKPRIKTTIVVIHPLHCNSKGPVLQPSLSDNKSG